MFDFIHFEIAGKLVAALLLSLPMAWNREKAERAAGIRTFCLVSVTACGFLLAGFGFLEEQIGNARLMQGLIGGLGFLGGGAILKSNGSVHGMATAASIWSAGAIGMAVAYGQWEVAVVLSLMNALTLRLGTEVKEAVGHDGDEKDDRPSQD
jgi:putative Mg2+ transporter-C (MgtC) family protein